jgi:hypothetical protein
VAKSAYVYIAVWSIPYLAMGLSIFAYNQLFLLIYQRVIPALSNSPQKNSGKRHKVLLAANYWLPDQTAMQQFAFIVLQLIISLLNRLITWLNLCMYIQLLVCLSATRYSRLVNSIFGCDIIRFCLQSVVSTYIPMCQVRLHQILILKRTVESGTKYYWRLTIGRLTKQTCSRLLLSFYDCLYP